MKKILPWIFAGAIFIYLFKKYPPGELVQATHTLRITPFILYMLLYFGLSTLIDCWSLANLFTKFGFPIKTREIVPVRLASYSMMILNYGAAQGLFAYFFKNKKNIPLFQSTSLILFTSIIDVYWTIALAFVGSFFAHLYVGKTDFSRFVQILWGGATVGLGSIFVFWKLPLNWKAIHWIKSRDLFHTFHRAKISHYLLALLLRLPLHLIVNTSLYFIAYFFGIHIPFLAVIALEPIVVLIGTIPITPGGIGTVQLAIAEFFKPFVEGDIITRGLVTPGEILVSMSLIAIFANYLLKAIVGIFFLKKAL